MVLPVFLSKFLSYLGSVELFSCRSKPSALSQSPPASGEHHQSHFTPSLFPESYLQAGSRVTWKLSLKGVLGSLLKDGPIVSVKPPALFQMIGHITLTSRWKVCNSAIASPSSLSKAFPKINTVLAIRAPRARIPRRTAHQCSFIHSDMSSKSLGWKMAFFSLAMGPSSSTRRHLLNLSQ